MNENPKPHWDADRRELIVANTVIKRFRRPSQNQEKLLATFEEEGWGTKIYDPLPGNADSKHRLRDTVYHLNRHHLKKGVLHFSTDGTGEAVLWELRHIFGTHIDDTEV